MTSNVIKNFKQAVQTGVYTPAQLTAVGIFCAVAGILIIILAHRIK